MIKALSAMRLCKEDATPNAILTRNLSDAEPPFLPALPTIPGSVSDIANEVDPELRGGPCLFQGSIGTAYN